MRKLIITAAMLVLTSAAFAGQAVTQLGSAIGMEASETGVAMPAAPALDAASTASMEDAELKSICHKHHNNWPGCPGYCNAHPMHVSCRPPAYCHTNPSGYGCPKGIEAGLYADDDGYDKSHCGKHGNNWPGCPGYCNAHPMHSSCRPPAYCHTNPSGYNCPKAAAAEEKGMDAEYAAELKSIQLNQCHKHNNNWPGCPGYCNAHPMHSSCRPPAYCHTNPSGYNCPKAAAAEEKSVDTEDAEAKSLQINQCHKHGNNWPGCPGYCNAHPMHSSCRPPAYCHTNPSGYGCPKSMGMDEEKGLQDVADEAEAKSICHKHKMRPGCPLFCSLNPLHKSCKHTPAYCHTNPNGYGCKSVGAEKDAALEKKDCGYNNGQHPGCANYCKYHQTSASCALPFHCKNNMQLYACKKHCKDYPLSQGCN